MSIDIEKLAREAGMPMAWISDAGVMNWTDLNRFAALVLEQAAQKCDQLDKECAFESDTHFGFNLSAEAIRAMKPKDAA